MMFCNSRGKTDDEKIVCNGGEMYVQIHYRCGLLFGEGINAIECEVGVALMYFESSDIFRVLPHR